MDIYIIYHTFKIENGCVIFYAKNDDNVETHTVYYHWIFDWFFTGFYWFFTLVNKLVSIQVFWVGVTRFLNLVCAHAQTYDYLLINYKT